MLVERIAALERLKAAAAAGQARLAAALDEARRSAEAAAGVPAARRGRGVATEVALARRDSPARGGRHLGFAKALVHEMPHTLAALENGVLSEWRATLVVRESACLDVEDRARLDAELCADPAALEGLGDAALTAAAKAIAYRLDPHAVVDRAAKAASERTVTIRPAPDTMTYVTALLPVAQGVSVYAALKREADVCCDGRSRGQVMADTLVERVTGRPADQAVPVTVNVVISDQALLGAESRRRRSWATARCPRRSRRRWSATPSPTRGRGPRCAGCTPDRAVGHWSPWTRAHGCSPRVWPSSSSCVTSAAGCRTATHPSGTATMPRRIAVADPPARSTAWASARPATTPKKRRAGRWRRESPKTAGTQPNSPHRPERSYQSVAPPAPGTAATEPGEVEARVA